MSRFKRVFLAWVVVCLEILLLITLISGAGRLSDLKAFFFDRLALLGLLILAVLPAYSVAQARAGTSLVGNSVKLAFFLTVAVSVFLDGHGAGWSHSTSLGEKLGISIVYLAILLVSLGVPAALYLLSFATCVSLRWWFTRSTEQRTLQTK